MCPLERGDEVLEFIGLFVENTREATCLTFDKDLLKIFEDYDWPGNIRELSNMVTGCCPLSGRAYQSGSS